MENTSLVFFGKPNSFESYEFNNDGITKNSHSEPKLKLNQEHNDILHYYFQDDFYYLELYGFANACNSGRSGIVIGVCIKSDTPIMLSSKNKSILTKLLDFFKSEVLSGTMFKDNNLEKYINTFNIKNEIYLAINYKTSCSNQNKSNLMLLFFDDDLDNIQNVEGGISDYTNLYISSNKDIFYSQLNSELFFETGNIFHIVTNNRLVEFKEPPKVSQQPIQLTWKKEEDNSSPPINVKTREENDSAQNTLTKTVRKLKPGKKIIFSVVAGFLFVAVAFLLYEYQLLASKNGELSNKIIVLESQLAELKRERTIIESQNQLGNISNNNSAKAITNDQITSSNVLIENKKTTEKSIAKLEITNNSKPVSDFTLSEGKSLTLKVSSQDEVTWMVETEFVNIKPDGNTAVVTGEKEGKATITVTTKDGTNAICIVRVKKATPAELKK